MSKLRVAVVRGGPGHEYEVSLNTGKSVLEHLPQHYEAQDVLIDKQGIWHHRGLPLEPRDLGRVADLALIALHGEYGEDGQIQSIFDQIALPYTGSGSFASAVGMNKQLAKNMFRQAGLKAPLGELLTKQGDAPETVALQAKDIFQQISPPWIVKPADRGSSVGLYLARNFRELVHAISQSYKFSNKVLVEEYLKGREATVGVIDDFRGHATYALPPIEIRRPGGQEIWTYDDKYNGATEEICPGAFTEEEKRELERQAVAAHKILGMRHYSRSDFILTSRGIYILETNSLPGMTSESLLPKALKAVGCGYGDFLEHLIQLALKK